jgi:hypothetical protein
MIFYDLQQAITKVCAEPTFIPHKVTALDEVSKLEDGEIIVRRVYSCEIKGIGFWKETDADRLFQKVCQGIIYAQYHKCPECGGEVTNGVCSSAACKSRLL